MVVLAVQDAGNWDIVTWMSILIAMGLMPFAFSMVTSFAKLVIVGGILRQALGLQQIPPNSVITGLALILTLHVMSPVVIASWQRYEALGFAADTPNAERVQAIAAEAQDPLRSFLTDHADRDNVDLFRSLIDRLRGDAASSPTPLLAEDSPLYLVAVMAPAFLLTELTEAFQIGFLIFVPFLILDLVVSNLLLAMGMHMLSPTTVSLPLKLLLFVLIDGWSLILQGLVLGYTPA